MEIVVIDDEPLTLDVLSIALRYLNHTCRTFRRPAEALAALGPSVDLVLSDVQTQGMDGFATAEKVRQILGVSPPRTLLMSHQPSDERLAVTPPSLVIGLLPKPFLPSDLFRALGILGETRTQCPGVAIPDCECAHSAWMPGPGVPQARPCLTSQYTLCPHYDDGCGSSLRRVVRDTVEALV